MTSLDAFQNSLAEGECAVIFSAVSRRYLSGFSSSDGVLFITRNQAFLYLDSRYHEMAQIAQKNGKIPPSVSIRPYLFFREFEGVLAAREIDRVLLEDRMLTVAEWHSLEKRFPTARFSPLEDRITRLRKIKTAEEIFHIAEAQRLTEEAFLHILDFISPSRTELEVAAELERFMKIGGATSPSFNTIAVSGTKSSLPHGTPENVKLSQNAFLTMDFGCVLDGYCSDMTRTVCLGKASEEMRLVYQTVLEAQKAGIDAVHAGVSGSEVDRAARGVIESRGFGEAFGHATGHGVGLEVHEAPAFSPRAEEKVPAGCVLSVEPGIYLAGKFGVRIEDLVVVEEGGCRNLNSAPKELLEL